MAWQNPKTDWGAADGVRDTDFNRIEGNLLELYTTDAARADVTIYVSTSGSDSGEGSSGSPYATISKALSVLPKNLNGKNIIVNIAAGTYADDILVDGFNNGVLILKASGSVSVRSLLVRNATLRVEINSFTVTTGVAGAGIIAYDNGCIIFTGDVVTQSSTQGIVANSGSIQVSGTARISNVNTGISATNNGNVFAFAVTGSGIGTGMIASNGGVIAYGTFSATISTAISATTTGGRINTGSQSAGGIGGGGGVL